MNRRDFVRTLALGAVVTAAGAPEVAQAAATLRNGAGRAVRIPLGMDNFAIRAMKLTGRGLVDFAAGLRLDTLFITDLPGLGSLEVGAAAELKKYAAGKGLALLVGSWSICPTSVRFKPDWGTAEEHLALGLKLSKAAGSPIFRVVLGGREDRATPGGIEARIADTVKVLNSQRSLARDLGVKVAVENHAGDMTARELVQLIEAAGSDWVGVNLDSGNALWTLEDPTQSLEILGPHTLATSLRDSAVWATEKGAKVQWTAFGEGGVVDWTAYFRRYAQLCPQVPVNVETIGGFAVEFPYLQADFWKTFPRKPAGELAQFEALVRRGRPVPQHDGGDVANQRGELERSLRYLREIIGLGLK